MHISYQIYKVYPINVYFFKTVEKIDKKPNKNKKNNNKFNKERL